MKESVLMSREDKRAKFGEGPWLEEPDRVEWRAHGFACLLRRVPLGVWCGYVGVPEGHPWHGQPDVAIDAEAHGGICYAAHCDGEVCHVPEPGEPEHLYWIGFDAAHAFDVVPATRMALKDLGCFAQAHLYPELDDVYRDVAYMRAEVEALALQAAQARAQLGHPR